MGDLIYINTITKIEKNIIINVKKNQYRNRKTTRGSITKELKSTSAIIYTSSNILERKGYLTYTKINKVESSVMLTPIGELIFSEIN